MIAARHVVGFVAVVLCSATASADLIRFKDGSTFRGKVVKRTATEAIVQLDFGTMSVAPGDIVGIEEDAPPEQQVNAPTIPPAATPATITAPPATHANEKAIEPVGQVPAEANTPETGATETTLDRAVKAVAFIATLTKEGQLKSGSGVLIGPNGTMVTNYHVVDNAQKIGVLLSGKKRESRFKDPKAYDASIVKFDERYDLAIVDIHAKTPDYLQFADTDDVRVGDEVRAIGNPQGLTVSVSRGIVSAVRTNKDMYLPYQGIPGDLMSEREFDGMTWIQTDASVNPGNSGGPLLNRDNHIVGINTFIVSKSGGSEGLNFALHVKHVRKFASGYYKKK